MVAGAATGVGHAQRVGVVEKEKLCQSKVPLDAGGNVPRQEGRVRRAVDKRSAATEDPCSNQRAGSFGDNFSAPVAPD